MYNIIIYGQIIIFIFNPTEYSPIIVIDHNSIINSDNPFLLEEKIFLHSAKDFIMDINFEDFIYDPETEMFSGITINPSLYVWGIRSDETLRLFWKTENG